MPSRTFPVILEYCGGARTDALYQALAQSNPDYVINVLDNASPTNRCSYITHHNALNTYIGGGICDCIAAATAAGCPFVLIVVNDIDLLSPLSIKTLEAMMDSDEDIVQIGTALSDDSAQVRQYPWMARHSAGALRRVPNCDIICTIIRISFLSTFGGFPLSKGGWGYNLELAYHAQLHAKRVLIADDFVVRHLDITTLSKQALGKHFDKLKEMEDVYRARYGDFSSMIRDAWRKSQRNYGQAMGL